MELDHVGHAAQSEPPLPDPEPAHDARVEPRLRPRLVNPLVQDAALSCQPVLGPELFDMYEGKLPLAEREVLQGGDGNQFSFGIHGANRSERGPP